MSTDSLVLKMFEVNEYGAEVNRVYVFYDHNLGCFGIRGGLLSKNTSYDYSYYTDTIQGVVDLLSVMLMRFYRVSLCLVKFSNFPAVSDNITYPMLVESDQRTNEIVGYDYGDNQSPCGDIEKFLKVLMTVYNDY